MAQNDQVKLPSFSELPVKEGAPADSSWGVWGDDDGIGTLNLLTPDRIVDAAQLVQRGAVFRLDQPIGYAQPPLFDRAPVVHTVMPHRPFANDDKLDSYNTQEGSQWDGLSHVGLDYIESYYNGVGASEIGPDSPEHKLGIHLWANKVVGRGLLLDAFGHKQKQGVAFDPLSASEYTVADLDAALADQGSTITTGTILLVRTGWLQGYLASSPEDKVTMGSSWEGLKSCGIEPTRAMAEWLWDNHVAAIALDCPAAETWPWDNERGPLHNRTLGLLGLPLGEQFNLEEVAADSAQDGRYDGMLVSTPLHLIGGIASPPNAVLIK